MATSEKSSQYQPNARAPGEPEAQRRLLRSRSFAVAVLALCLVFMSGLFQIDHHCSHAVSNLWRSKPRTIEERVKNILSTTPLIGAPSCSLG